MTAEEAVAAGRTVSLLTDYVSAQGRTHVVCTCTELAQKALASGETAAAFNCSKHTTQNHRDLPKQRLLQGILQGKKSSTFKKPSVVKTLYQSKSLFFVISSARTLSNSWPVYPPVCAEEGLLLQKGSLLSLMLPSSCLVEQEQIKGRLFPVFLTGFILKFEDFWYEGII